MEFYSSSKLEQVKFSPVRIISEKARIMEEAGRDIIRFQIGEPDFDTPKAIKDATIDALNRNLTHYTSNRGYPKLRKTVTRYLEETYGLQYDIEEILITCGAAEAIFDAMTAYLNPEDEVILPVPAYMNYKNVAAMNEAKCVTTKLDFDAEIQVDIEDIQRKITPNTKMMVVNNPNNPSGTVLSKKTLEALAAIAIEHDLLVLSDEIYGDIVYEEPMTSVASLRGMFDRTILVSGFSKTYAMTGWRMGYVACPTALYSPILKVHQYTTTCCPTFLQDGVAQAMLLDSCKAEVSDMLAIFKERRDYIVSRLSVIEPLKFVHPYGAFYLYVDVSGLDITNEDFAVELLEEEGVALVPGTAFDEDDCCYVRLSYAASMESIVEGLNRIERFCQKRNK